MIWHKSGVNILLVLLIIVLNGCAVRTKGKYAKRQNYSNKYEQALARYKAKDYYEASKLLEEAVSLLEGKKEIISAHFYQAYSSFYQKDYQRSAEQFQAFCETYPHAPQIEEALYMQAYSLYLASPSNYKVDQSFSEEAILVLKAYLKRYPEGTYKDQAIEYMAKLNAKLALKAFYNAKTYYRLAHYRAAVVALSNFEEDFSNSAMIEQAAYLKANAQYKFAGTVIESAQLPELRKALAYCHSFLDQYPASPYVRTIEKLCENMLSQINNLIRHP